MYAQVNGNGEKTSNTGTGGGENAGSNCSEISSIHYGQMKTAKLMATHEFMCAIGFCFCTCANSICSYIYVFPVLYVTSKFQNTTKPRAYYVY